MFSWFSTQESVRFGRELAAFLIGELGAAATKGETKFSAKAQKVLARGEQQVRQFKTRERLNGYKKAKLANAFLWALKDGGCEPDYARQLTEWLTLRL